MAQGAVSRLEEFFGERANDNLRSIVHYEREGFDVVYLRDDVDELYSEEEIETAIDDARMESLTAPIYEGTYSEAHGDLTCMVKCFKNVIEINFALADGVGVAVGLDAAAMTGTHGLVAEAREIVVEERG